MRVSDAYCTDQIFKDYKKNNLWGYWLSDFYESMLEGNKAKELIKVLLEKSGYSVYPYGYESTFSDIKQKLNVEDAKNSSTARRIRSSPDLLVYDEDKKDVVLAEIKMRRAPEETNVLIYPKIIKRLKEFWNDSVLIIVVPCGNFFYAQKVAELEIKEAYNAAKDFLKLDEIFTRVKDEDLSYFRTQAVQIMKK